MRKMIFYFVTVIVIAGITMACVSLTGKDENIDFLEQYGWTVEKEYIEKQNVAIPDEFDDVYTAYNDIQKQAGLDLTAYCGKKGIRYTYIVTNYPDEVGETVRANVICIGGKPVAGDIMTVSLRGFMHSLKFPKTTQ